MNWNQLTPQQQQMLLSIMNQMMGGAGGAAAARGLGTGNGPPPGTPVAGQTGLGGNPLLGNYMQRVMATQQPQLLQYLMGSQGGGGGQMAQQPSLAQLLQQQGGSPMGGAQ